MVGTLLELRDVEVIATLLELREVVGLLEKLLAQDGLKPVEQVECKVFELTEDDLEVVTALELLGRELADIALELVRGTVARASATPWYAGFFCKLSLNSNGQSGRF